MVLFTVFNCFLQKNYVLSRFTLEDNPIEDAGKEALAFGFRVHMEFIVSECHNPR
jgi:hypothetical protein